LDFSKSARPRCQMECDRFWKNNFEWDAQAIVNVAELCQNPIYFHSRG
jgi:hypothetical protein